MCMDSIMTFYSYMAYAMKTNWWHTLMNGSNSIPLMSFMPTPPPRKWNFYPSPWEMCVWSLGKNVIIVNHISYPLHEIISYSHMRCDLLCPWKYMLETWKCRRICIATDFAKCSFLPLYSLWLHRMLSFILWIKTTLFYFDLFYFLLQYYTFLRLQKWRSA